MAYSHSNQDRHDEVTCPYDDTHQISLQIFPKHIIRCRKNHPHVKKAHCPFNYRHVVNPDELRSHMVTCPDRKRLDFEVKAATVVKKMAGAPSAPIVRREFACDENWDEDEEDEGLQPNVIAQVHTNMAADHASVLNTYADLNGFSNPRHRGAAAAAAAAAAEARLPRQMPQVLMQGQEQGDMMRSLALAGIGRGAPSKASSMAGTSAAYGSMSNALRGPTQQEVQNLAMYSMGRGTMLHAGHMGNGHMTNGHMGNGHMGNGHMTNGHMTNGYGPGARRPGAPIASGAPNASGTPITAGRGFSAPLTSGLGVGRSAALTNGMPPLPGGLQGFAMPAGMSNGVANMGVARGRGRGRASALVGKASTPSPPPSASDGEVKAKNTMFDSLLFDDTVDVGFVMPNTNTSWAQRVDDNDSGSSDATYTGGSSEAPGGSSEAPGGSSSDTVSASSANSADSKLIRKLTRKLQQIEKLEENQRAGSTLNAEEKAKIKRKNDIIEQLEILRLASDEDDDDDE